MKLLTAIYRLRHRDIQDDNIPYYWKYPLWTVICKPIRKFFSAVVIPTIPFNNIRIWGYRICGYKIGGGTFIGMRCYLDDLCYDLIEIGNNVTISYGVYFACHGRKQGHNKLVIRDGAYIGMGATIIAKTDIEIGRKAVIGARTLVNKSVPAGKTAVGIPCHILESKQ
ncbi:MAG: acyltransferase [Prevotella sp.]|nr:acyltransferase [Prevotella sp.]